MKMDFDYLDFICWVDRCLFPVDLSKDLQELGFEKQYAIYYEIEWKHYVQEGNLLSISRLYQNYCITRDDKELEKTDVGYWLKLYLEQQYKKWQAYK